MEALGGSFRCEQDFQDGIWIGHLFGLLDVLSEISGVVG
jgi:hypothetical protein